MPLSTKSYSFDLSNKVALVTGAASGLGEAMATALASRGARLALIDIDAKGLERVSSRLAGGCAPVTTQTVDITDRQALRAAIDKVATRLQRLDAVFANAGIGSGPGFSNPDGTQNAEGSIEAVSDDLWDRVISVNLTSVFTTVQRAAKHMKAFGNGGRIIVTTSVASFSTAPWIGTPYFPSKAGAAHLVRQMALELAPHSITVNAIAPGAFATNIGGGRLKLDAVARTMGASIPLGRIASPDEIGGLAVFLASDESSYITGIQIPIDGGSSLGTKIAGRSEPTGDTANMGEQNRV